MSKVSKVRKKEVSGCLMGGFFGVFAIAGLATSYFMTWLPMSNLIAARGWEERVCEILSSQVAESRSSDGSTYRVDIRYRYQVEWETYDGDRYDFSTGSSSGYESKRRAVDAHPPGSETPCYVDPDDPTRSVINRKPGGYLWWGLFPLPFLAVGIGGLLFTFTSTGPRKRVESKSGAAGSATSAKSFREVVKERSTGAAASHGLLELEPEISPLGKIIGTFFIAAFWNGIVSIFLFTTVIPGFRSGDIDWIPTLFLIPFVLVGVGLISFFFYQILAWFNPRPQLTLEEGHLTPGAATSLRWQFRGRPGRLRQLTMTFEGREAARYRRGTSTYTDHHVFHTEDLLTATGFHQIHRGETSLQVPQSTMPSFKSPNNEIEWRLKIRGDIPFWPDVIENFEITIYPP